MSSSWSSDSETSTDESETDSSSSRSDESESEDSEATSETHSTAGRRGVDSERQQAGETHIDTGEKEHTMQDTIETILKISADMDDLICRLKVHESI